MIDEVEKVRLAVLERHGEEMRKLDELHRTIYACDAEIRKAIEDIRDGSAYRRNDNATLFIDVASALLDVQEPAYEPGPQPMPVAAPRKAVLQ